MRARFPTVSRSLPRADGMGCSLSSPETSIPKKPMKTHSLLPFVSRAAHWSICGILAASAHIWPLSGKTHAAAYTFTSIADADGIFAKAGNNREGIGTAQLSINNAGTVAFRSFLDDGGTGVFTGSGGPIQSIALSSDPIFRVVVGASINSAGTVAFLGILDSGGQGIFTGNNSQITTIALNTEPTFSTFGFPFVNDAGKVGFNVLLTDGSRSIVTRNGGLTTTIAAESGPIFSGVGGNISINSSGTVAFFGRLENGQFGIFSGSGGPPKTITLGSALDLSDGTSINDAGSVAFNFGGAVYVGNGNSLTIIADTGGPFGAFGRYSAINNLGKVVFLAGLDSGGGGIFTGPDPVADKVIRIGESLFGSSLVSAEIEPLAQIFGNMDINDLGQVAFHYELADGRQGIAVANPVPEPSSLSLLFIVIGLIAARRKSHPAGRRSASLRLLT